MIQPRRFIAVKVAIVLLKPVKLCLCSESQSQSILTVVLTDYVQHLRELYLYFVCSYRIN